MVYIAEAHASDEWPINSSRCAGPANSVRRPTSLIEREAIARRMVSAMRLDDGGPPVYVDGMDDAFLEAYAAWPVRLYGVSKDGRLAHIAHPEDATFHLPRLRDWLLAEASKA